MYMENYKHFLVAWVFATFFSTIFTKVIIKIILEIFHFQKTRFLESGDVRKLFQ